MSGRVLVWVGVAVAVLAAVVLVVFWLVQGLEQAGWLAGVLSAFTAVAAFVIALPLRSRSSPSSSEAERPGGSTGGGGGSSAATSNTFSGGTNAGPLVMGRDISGPVTSGPPVPPPVSPLVAPSPPSSTESAGSPALKDESAEADGAVSNVFSGGTNYGPLVMGRDISGLVASHGTPAADAAQLPLTSGGPAGQAPAGPSGEAAGPASPGRPGDESTGV
ncbi:hypothetical protein [Actinomadura harenae]|uniref:hypothetical protein n=1 Tax=Actinomadura harenae TaxID=2483351 RepID=UPI00131569F1|nr:hypothetical protein [Actinomadura harenae]